MKIKTYSELRKNINSGDRPEAHKKAAAEARTEIEVLKNMRKEAVEANDPETFKDICDRISFCRERLEVEQRKAEESELSTEDILATWDEYASEYNKTIAKKKTALEKITKAFAEEYIDLLAFEAEGNRERVQVRADLAGRRVGTYDAGGLITSLENYETSIITQRGQTPESAITAKALKLGFGPVENMTDIEQGHGTNGDIYAKCFMDKIREIPSERKPIFSYPIRMPETKEAKKRRKFFGEVTEEYGYLMSDGTWDKYEKKIEDE